MRTIMIASMLLASSISASASDRSDAAFALAVRTAVEIQLCETQEIDKHLLHQYAIEAADMTSGHDYMRLTVAMQHEVNGIKDLAIQEAAKGKFCGNDGWQQPAYRNVRIPTDPADIADIQTTLDEYSRTLNQAIKAFKASEMCDLNDQDRATTQDFLVASKAWISSNVGPKFGEVSNLDIDNNETICADHVAMMASW